MTTIDIQAMWDEQWGADLKVINDWGVLKHKYDFAKKRGDEVQMAELVKQREAMRPAYEAAKERESWRDANRGTMKQVYDITFPFTCLECGHQWRAKRRTDCPCCGEDRMVELVEGGHK